MLAGVDLPFLSAIFHIPLTRQPFDIHSAIVYLLPACLSYIVIATLVVLPGTRTLRVALWPLITILAFRGAVSVDLSNGDPQKSYRNVDFGVSHYQFDGDCIMKRMDHLAFYALCFNTHFRVVLFKGAAQAAPPPRQLYPIRGDGRT